MFSLCFLTRCSYQFFDVQMTHKKAVFNLEALNNINCNNLEKKKKKKKSILSCPVPLGVHRAIKGPSGENVILWPEKLMCFLDVLITVGRPYILWKVTL